MKPGVYREVKSGASNTKMLDEFLNIIAYVKVSDVELGNLKKLNRLLEFLTDVDLSDLKTLKKQELDEIHERLYNLGCDVSDVTFENKTVSILPYLVIALLGSLAMSILGMPFISIAALCGTVGCKYFLKKRNKKMIFLKEQELLEKASLILDNLNLLREAKKKPRKSKKIEEKQGKTLQDRVYDIHKIIVKLPKKDAFYFHNRLVGAVNEYKESVRLASQTDAVLEFEGKPYYVYCLENSLTEIEKGLEKLAINNISFEDFNKTFADYNVNVANFTDKNAAFMELMNMVSGRLNKDNVAESAMLASNLADSFWITIKAMPSADRGSMVYALLPVFLDWVILKGEAVLRDIAPNELETLKREANMEDKKMYLMLLVNTLEGSKAFASNYGRSRTEGLVSAC